MAKTPRPTNLTKKHLARLEKEQIQRRYIVIATAVIMVLVIGVIIFGVLDENVFKYNRPVAQVNGEKITLKEFQTRVRFDRFNLIQQYNQTQQMAQIFGSDESTAQYFQSQLTSIAQQMENDAVAKLAIDQLVNEKLIEQEAAKRGITVSEAELEARLQEYFGFYANGTPTPAPTATEFATPTLNPTQLAIVTITPTPTEAPTSTPEPTATPDPALTPTAEPTPAAPETPAPTPTPYTLEGYQADLKTYGEELAKYQITEDDLRDIFRADLLRTKMEEVITADVKPEQEMVWARHILVPDQGAAENVLARLQKGDDFGQLAAEVSTDTSNNTTGGDLGWFPRGQMVTEFENAAFELQVGEISAPVQTSFGFHIIQVLGHENRPLDSNQLDSAKNAAFNTWLEGLSTAEGAVQRDEFTANWQNEIPTEPALGE